MYSPYCQNHPAGVERHAKSVLGPRHAPGKLIGLLEEHGVPIASSVAVQRCNSALESRMVEVFQRVCISPGFGGLSWEEISVDVGTGMSMLLRIPERSISGSSWRRITKDEVFMSKNSAKLQRPPGSVFLDRFWDYSQK